MTYPENYVCAFVRMSAFTEELIQIEREIIESGKQLARDVFKLGVEITRNRLIAEATEERRNLQYEKERHEAVKKYNREWMRRKSKASKETENPRGSCAFFDKRCNPPKRCPKLCDSSSSFCSHHRKHAGKQHNIKEIRQQSIEQPKLKQKSTKEKKSRSSQKPLPSRWRWQIVANHQVSRLKIRFFIRNFSLRGLAGLCENLFFVVGPCENFSLDNVVECEWTFPFTGLKTIYLFFETWRIA